MGRDSDNASLNRAPCAASKASLREPLSPESQRLTLSRQAYASVSPYFKRLIQTNWRNSGDVDRTLKAYLSSHSRPTRPLLLREKVSGEARRMRVWSATIAVWNLRAPRPQGLPPLPPLGEGGPTGRMRAGAKRPFAQLGTGKRDNAIHDVVDIFLR